MGDDRRDDPPSTKAGAAAMRAVIRPQGDSATDSTRGPLLPTASMPAVPDARAPQAHKPHAKTTQQSALAMTECSTCHVATPVARFCTDCGAPLVQRNFCSGCGAHLLPAANFCDVCGLKCSTLTRA
jgi:predicted amidophosphoribosyltransferase